MMTPERANEILNLTSNVKGLKGFKISDVGSLRDHMTPDEIHYTKQVWETMPGSASFVSALTKIANEDSGMNESNDDIKEMVDEATQKKQVELDRFLKLAGLNESSERFSEIFAEDKTEDGLWEQLEELLDKGHNEADIRSFALEEFDVEMPTNEIVDILDAFFKAHTVEEDIDGVAMGLDDYEAQGPEGAFDYDPSTGEMEAEVDFNVGDPELEEAHGDGMDATTSSLLTYIKEKGLEDKARSMDFQDFRTMLRDAGKTYKHDGSDVVSSKRIDNIVLGFARWNQIQQALGETIEEMEQAEYDHGYAEKRPKRYSMNVHDYKGRAEASGGKLRRVNNYGDNPMVAEKNTELEEGTWSSPQDVGSATQLADLLKKPIAAENATDTLYSLIGDDDLFDMIDESNPGEDVRSLVVSKLEEWLDGDMSTWNKPWDEKAIAILRQAMEAYENENMREDVTRLQHLSGMQIDEGTCDKCGSQHDNENEYYCDDCKPNADKFEGDPVKESEEATDESIVEEDVMDELEESLMSEYKDMVIIDK